MILLSILNYNNFDNHLITRFYKQKALPKPSNNRVKSEKLKEIPSEDFVTTKIANVKDYFYD